MKLKSNSMVMFGQIMLVVWLVGAGVCALLHNRPRMIMFLLGSVVWIIAILIHNRNTEHG